MCVSWSFCRPSVFDLHPPWFALSLVCASLPLHSASFFPEIVCIRRLVDGPACACLSTRPLLRVLLLFARSAALFSLSLWLACEWQSPVSWLWARCCCISRARAAATRVRSALFFFCGVRQWIVLVALIKLVGVFVRLRLRPPPCDSAALRLRRLATPRRLATLPPCDSAAATPLRQKIYRPTPQPASKQKSASRVHFQCPCR